MRFNGSAMRLRHEQGVFCDRMVVKAATCVPVGADTPPTHAACSEPLAVCLRARSRAGDLTGKRALATGAGPIGALRVALTRRGGAAEVVATDLQDATLAVATRMGAQHALSTGRDPSAPAPWIADKGAFDGTFECSAPAPAWRAAIEATKPGGTIVQAGATGDIAIPLKLLAGKKISLTGAHRFHAEFAEAAGMISCGDIDVSPMITGTYPIADASVAFAAPSRWRSRRPLAPSW
jgi:L-idonate 5-dehydrogenase